MKEYFTPEIEDLRIGYECEIHTNYGYESFNEGKERWVSIIIGYMEGGGAFTNEIGNIINGMSDGYQPVRVPYLTQEQIEKEGWIWRRTYDRDTTFNGKYPTKMEFEKGDVWVNGAFLKYEPENNIVKIITIDKGFNMDGPNSSIKYNGDCKDINTLRSLQKLIGI